MDLISPSFLENMQKRSKKCHERFCLSMEEWTESSDKSSAESEVPKWKPLKKNVKLSVPKDKENRWQFVDDATEAALSKEFDCAKKYRYKHQMGRVELCCLEKWAKCSRSNP